MKRIISLILCFIMCFSVFSSTAIQASAIGAADKLFIVKGGTVKDGKITYTVSLTGGIEGFGGAVVQIQFDNTVLAPAEDGFKPAYTSSGVQQFKGYYVNGMHNSDETIYSVGYMNSTPEAVKNNTEFFSITFDVINDARPKTSVGFYCKEFFSTTNEEQSITPADGLQTIAIISDINTLETPRLVGAELKTNAIEFQWEAVVGATGYEIRRKTLVDTWQFIAKVSGDELTYSDINLESGTTYIYSVRAINNDGPGLYDSTGVTCRYISKPVDVVASTGIGGVDISWSAVTGADKYKIMRRELGAEEWEVLEERAANLATNFKDTTVENGKTYEYDVNSVLGSFVTDTLTEGKVVTYLTSPAISSVKNIRDGIELVWENVENSAYYVVYRKAVGVETEFSVYAAAVTSNSFVDYDVQAGKAYTYSVQAVSNYGNESAFTKTGYTITRVPSTIVTNVVPLANSIKVYFQKVDGVDGYRIYRKTKDSDWQRAGTAFVSSEFFEDTLVPGGQEYFYCAVPYIGNSESERVPTDEGVYFLKSPQNVKSVNTKDDLKVTWDVVAGAGEYNIFKSTDGTDNFTLVGNVKAGESLEYIDSDVEVDSIYYYKVQAVSSKGQSFESEMSPATMRITCVKGIEAKRVAEGIFIEWRSHRSADSYIICRNENGKWERIGEPVADVEYTDTTVESGKTYSYAVIPVVGEFEGGIDEVVEMKYIAAPTITSATSYKSTVKIEWSKVAGAKKYRLQRVTLDSDGNSVGSYKTIATVSDESFKDTDLVAGRRYSYRVCAIADDVESVASKPYRHIFLKNPEISSLSNAYGGIKVSWSSVKNAQKYAIMRKESAGDWKTIKTISASKTSYTDKTAKNGVKYYYAVKALADESESYYESKSFTYFASPKATVVNKTSAITVSWDKISGAKSYYVYRKCPGDTSWKRIAIVTKNIYTDKDVKNGKTYKYTVKAYNGSIFSGYNTSGWTIKRLAPPKLKTITNATSGITIKWGKVTGASKYIVMRKASGSSTWEEIKTTTSLSFTDKTAKPGKIYTYTVKAGYSDYRSIYIADGLKMKRLEKPSLGTVKSSKKGVTFTWDAVTGASGYLVYRKTGSGEWEQIAKVTGASTESYVDTTAKKGKTYYYSVRAYSGSYKSAYNTTGLKIKDKY